MSSRSLIKSMLVIGGAQVVNIAISIVRMKALALLLGPAGIGLLGIFNSLLNTVTTVSGLGLGQSGVRELANARGEEKALSRVRIVMFSANLVQGTLAMALVWLFREPLAYWLLGNSDQSTEVGLVGIAVLLTLLAASQTTLLQGLRRVTDLGRATVLAALAWTATGLPVVWLIGEGGLIWFVLIQPFTAILVALYFTRRLPRPATARLSLPEIWDVWRPMAKLGAVFMLGQLATMTTLLLVRSWIAKDIGLDAAGYFAAAWGITTTYVGFLLASMSADYYPRLTEVIRDRPAATRLINDQIQLGLALGGPVLLLLVGLAPWVTILLYSADFTPAVELLQWQTVGNVFKLASWPLAFALVAAARSRAYLGIQLITWNSPFLAFIWFGLPIFGLVVTGVGFLASYILYFALLILYLRLRHGFIWDKLSVLLIGLHVMLSFMLLALARITPHAGALLSIILALVTGLAGLRIVVSKIGPDGRFPSKVVQLYRAIGWPIEFTDNN